MKSLLPLWREACLRWWRWALSEIHPLHPDVPYVVLRIAFLEGEKT